jgi:hypothetical protein
MFSDGVAGITGAGSGICEAEAARIILDGIAKGDFWVSTHPELTAETARGRSEYLSNLGAPVLAETARVILRFARKA